MAVRAELLSNGTPRTSLVQCCGDVSALVLDSGNTTGSITGDTGSVAVSRQADGQVCASLVLKPSNYVYLRVKPEEVMWIDVGYDFDYNVFSNTDWMVN